ncbi:hypothetical protein GCM10010987_36770 [Bradyrhizobium guangdongense]|uniref:Uncharacterized protein n=1 Tax=Bradyrhizobium guangdongense TaxID=1325090 RepID=A0AA88B963_9BRAD|nr:hypothetical protein XH86_39330 [Bradyrhizobium guangdongense]GGI25913.1 hypothetical protein GCM10010987_36770 [Bradyrhizobium guangdongense]
MNMKLTLGEIDIDPCLPHNSDAERPVKITVWEIEPWLELLPFTAAGIRATVWRRSTSDAPSQTRRNS